MEQFCVKASPSEELRGWYWPAEAPRANLTVITGMDEYAARYDAFARWMNEREINVWVLDAFGQGLNAESAERQELWPKDAFRKTLRAIHGMNRLARQNGLQTVQMGHSMGSFLTQALIEKYPHYTDKVILCGSNGGQDALMKTGYALSRLLVNDRNRDEPSSVLQSMGLGSYARSVKGRKTDFDWLSVNEENVQDYIRDPYCGQINSGGFWREFLRGMAQIWDRRSLRHISEQERILIISGADDPVGRMGKGPQWLYDKYRELGVQDVSLRLYEGMRHEILHETDREKVFTDILAFIL
ncbi:MAG: alpha/beta hydrolase [Eubacteriales bacterium]|nr:alpha/beta hydrolase [Eubacteriales bacterium]